jgi:hypothetical protein
MYGIRTQFHPHVPGFFFVVSADQKKGQIYFQFVENKSVPFLSCYSFGSLLF